MSKPNRQKTYVDPQVQGALVRRLVLHWLGFFVVTSLVAFCLQVLSNPFRSFGGHAEQLWWTQGPFLMVMIFLLPVFVLDTVRLSNRFAGPIYRLRETIRSLAQGEPTQPLKFRDDDYWQSLAEDFTHMVDRLKRNDAESDENDEHATVSLSGSSK